MPSLFAGNFHAAKNYGGMKKPTGLPA